jgi:hypothetical protein
MRAVNLRSRKATSPVDLSLMIDDLRGNVQRGLWVQVTLHIVIASQRVRAKRGADDRLHEAIQNLSAATVRIASSLQRKIASQFCRGLLAMTNRQACVFISAAWFARRFAQVLAPGIEGAGNAGYMTGTHTTSPSALGSRSRDAANSSIASRASTREDRGSASPDRAGTHADTHSFPENRS